MRNLRMEKEEMDAKGERLIQRYRRHHSIVRARNKSEAGLLAETMSMRRRKDIGGEGVEYIEAAKDTGYWFVTLFAYHGRAFAAGPMAVYTAYVLLIVLVMQNYCSAYIKNKDNALIFQGLQTSLTMVGVALFFLQTFRVNSAYSRWWEGRGVWSTISMALVSLATLNAAQNVQSRKLARRLIRWGLAYIITLKLSLRREESLAEIEEIMSRAELQELQGLPNNLRAVHCVQKIKETWGEAQRNKLLTECASKELEKILPDLIQGMGSSRRIMFTPMPFAYISHLRTFLCIWISVLPFVFMYYMQYLSIAVCLFIAYSLLGMEAISLEIEAPFGRDFNDLPTDNLTDEVVQVLLNAYESTINLPAPDGDDGDGNGLMWEHCDSMDMVQPMEPVRSNGGGGSKVVPVCVDGTAAGQAQQHLVLTVREEGLKAKGAVAEGVAWPPALGSQHQGQTPGPATYTPVTSMVGPAGQQPKQLQGSRGFLDV